jgi:hypothetical protein
MKALAGIILSLSFCFTCWAGETAGSINREDIQEQVRNAVRDLQMQIPELLKGVRVRVQVPDIQVQIPEIRVQLPEILIPGINLQVPVHVQIPEIQLPEIRIEIPRIDIQAHGLPE